jgi:calcineurin-like phosphoesterase family protein
MDNWLINSWNEVVGDNDIVFILGDITMFPDGHKIKKLLDQLTGKHIYIVPGNHDKVEKGFRLLTDERYTILHDITRVKLEGHELGNLEVMLSHVPLMTWPGRDKGIPNLFGHIHSGPRSTDGFDTNLPFWKNMYDVGVDNNDYTPVNLKSIWEKI